MSYEIRYTSKYTGREEVHKCNLSEGSARGWCKSLAKDHNCKAVCEHIADGPYDWSGKRTHIVSEGDKR